MIILVIWIVLSIIITSNIFLLFKISKIERDINIIINRYINIKRWE